MSTLAQTSTKNKRRRSNKSIDASCTKDSLILSADSPLTTPIDATKGRDHAAAPHAYTHKPSMLILGWLIISLPLVAWDTCYVLLRPHTMPGGKYHSPIFVPYALYGRTDYMYGWPAWNNHNGFTAAQSSINIVESLFYVWYLYIVGTNAVDWSYKAITQLEISSKGTRMAVLLAFSAAVMTVSKTVLYGLNEAFSGCANVGHNSVQNLILLWIIPNGLWIVVPTYMMYVLGDDILTVMNGARCDSKTATQ